MKHFWIIIFLFFPFNLIAQTTIITGTINGNGTQSLAYANVYLKNTTIGTTSNEDGEFQISIPNGKQVLVFQFLGFRKKAVTLQAKGETITLDINLRAEGYLLKEVVVAASGKDPADEIIQRAIEKRPFYLEQINRFSCEVYIKGLQNIEDAPENFLGYAINIDGLDDERSGIVYLSESVSKLYFKRPDKYKEIIVSSKVSGTDNGFSFNRASVMNFNFYQNNLDVGPLSERGFVSPIAQNARAFYRYKYVGSFEEDGYKVHKIQVIPKRKNAPVFHGHIYIQDGSWRIHSTDLLVVKGASIEFVDTLTINQTYAPYDKDIWVLLSQKFNFRAKVLAFKLHGTYVGVYSNYTVNKRFPKKETKLVAVEPKNSSKKKVETVKAIEKMSKKPSESESFPKKETPTEEFATFPPTSTQKAGNELINTKPVPKKTPSSTPKLLPIPSPEQEKQVSQNPTSSTQSISPTPTEEIMIDEEKTLETIAIQEEVKEEKSVSEPILPETPIPPTIPEQVLNNEEKTVETIAIQEEVKEEKSVSELILPEKSIPPTIPEQVLNNEEKTAETIAIQEEIKEEKSVPKSVLPETPVPPNNQKSKAPKVQKSKNPNIQKSKHPKVPKSKELNIEFEDDDFFDNAIVVIQEGANKRDSIYWAKIRPVKLTQVEQQDYIRKDSIKALRETKTYKDSIDRKSNQLHPLKLLLTGYTFEKSNQKHRFYFSPLISNIQFNTVEGLRLGLRINYFKELSRKRWWRADARLRYGFANQHFNPYFTFTYYSRPKKFERLEAAFGSKVMQIDATNPVSELINSAYTLFLKRNYLKIYEQRFGKLRYRAELLNGFYTDISVSYADRRPLENRTDYSFRKNLEREFTPNEPLFERHQAFIVEAKWKLNFGQQYELYPDRKYVFETSKYPTLKLHYRKGIPILGSDVDFDQLELLVEYEKNFKLLGTGEYRLTLGSFLNKKNVPAVDVHYFNGNQTFLANDYLSTFQLTDYYEMATTDTYLQGHLEHHFNGAIVTKIPILRYFKWRAVAGINAFYVDSDINYAEYFVGFENIFKIARLDFVHSLTDTKKMGVRLGLTIF